VDLRAEAEVEADRLQDDERRAGVEPLARWAKLAITVQAITCLMILGLVIARAVNILP
jgi:hypothetical protein